MSNEAFAALLPEPAHRVSTKLGDIVCLRAQNFDGKKGDGLYTADQMRQMFDAATERAAILCEVEAGRASFVNNHGASLAADACAAAIRAGGEKT
jgi:hypothetical protein